MNFIDPQNPENYNKVLWCVYGPDCFPTIFCCVIKTASRNPAIWGYSEYRRSPGFRTLGREVVGGWVEEHDAKFFASQDDAFEYLRTLTTPRCDANGNKLKKPTKKEAALAMLKRIGAKKRTLIHGTEREEILGKIAFMVPVEKSSSLHWWSEDYIIDGVRYEVGGAHNSSNIELIERVEEIG